MDPSGYPQDPRALDPRHFAQVRVEIPQNEVVMGNMRAMQANDMYSDAQHMQYVRPPPYQPQHFPENAHVKPPQLPSAKQHSHHNATISPATEHQQKPQPIDYSFLLVSLAEEYFNADYRRSSSNEAEEREQDPNAFRKLIATGLACLENALKVQLRVLLDREDRSLKITSTGNYNLSSKPRSDYTTLQSSLRRRTI